MELVMWLKGREKERKLERDREWIVVMGEFGNGGFREKKNWRGDDFFFF